MEFRVFNSTVFLNCSFWHMMELGAFIHRQDQRSMRSGEPMEKSVPENQLCQFSCRFSRSIALVLRLYFVCRTLLKTSDKSKALPGSGLSVTDSGMFLNLATNRKACRGSICLLGNTFDNKVGMCWTLGC